MMYWFCQHRIAMAAVVCLLPMFSPVPVSAQSIATSRSLVYLEAGGKALLYGILLEKNASPTFSLAGGFSYAERSVPYTESDTDLTIRTGDSSVVLIPITLVWYPSRRMNMFFVEAGATVGMVLRPRKRWDVGIYGVAGIGLMLPFHGSWFFRIEPLLLIGGGGAHSFDIGIQPWISLSVGTAL